MNTTVIIPTIGSPHLAQAIESVIINDAEPFVVIDGPEYETNAMTIIKQFKCKHMILPYNTGGLGYYGHRIYAAASYLINTPYVAFLDQDNYYKPGHLRDLLSAMITINNDGKEGWDWAYSYRSIVRDDGSFVCNDEFESCGDFLVDTSCYLMTRDVARQLAPFWYGGWGQDRKFLAAAKHYFPKYGCSEQYSVCYRLGGNANSPTEEFFLEGNKSVEVEEG